MTLKVGHIPYLNAEPFYVDMIARGIELCEMIPSAAGDAICSGEVVAALVPLVDCFRLGDEIEPISGFGLSCINRAGSVLLYATRPIEELDGARIAVPDEASTAPQLLRVLLQLKYQVQPEAYVSLEEPHDAFLLIGNQALRQRRGARGFKHLYDLGEQWHTWTGMPFVFARWMIRRDADPQIGLVLQNMLYVGLEDGVNLMYQVSEPRRQLLMLPRDITEYIQGLRYFIRIPEQKAIEQFQHYLAQLEG